MISSDVIRGYNDTLILYMLLDGESYGYEISKNIRKLSDEKYVMKETTLYSAFTRLEKNGYIDSFFWMRRLGRDAPITALHRWVWLTTGRNVQNGRSRKRLLINL